MQNKKMSMLGLGLVFAAVSGQAQMNPVKKDSGTVAYAESISHQSLTLRDCYELAKVQSERLKIQMENIKQARALKKQAFGSILPNVRWKYDTIWQDTKGVEISSVADNTIFRSQRSESRLTLDQPIFSGFKEFSAMSGYEAAARRESYNLTRDDILLYQDVATAFLNVILIETGLFNTRTTIRLNEDRIKELRERVRIGRSRESEVVSAQSQLANLKSNEAQAMGDLVVARETLTYLIGRDVSSAPLVDNMAVPVLMPEEEALRALEDRSDIKALKEDSEAKRYAVRVARSGYWPGVDLHGNYYTNRLGFQSDIDWDLILAIDVPIFQGGSVYAQVQQALSVWHQAKLTFDQQTRLVRSEIRRDHASLVSSLQTSDLLEDAYQKAKRSYELQVKEYRYGLVTNIDVLLALTIMQDVKQNWDRSLLQSKLNNIRLLTATEKPFDPAQGW